LVPFSQCPPFFSRLEGENAVPFFFPSISPWMMIGMAFFLGWFTLHPPQNTFFQRKDPLFPFSSPAHRVILFFPCCNAARLSFQHSGRFVLCWLSSSPVGPLFVGGRVSFFFRIFPFGAVEISPSPHLVWSLWGAPLSLFSEI